MINMLSKEQLIENYSNLIMEYKQHLRVYYILNNQELTKEIIYQKSLIQSHQEFILQKNYENRTCEYIQERMAILRRAYLEFLREYTSYLEREIKSYDESTSNRKSELLSKWKIV